MRHLMAQRAVARGQGAFIACAAAFAGDDQHQTQPLGVAGQDKSDQRGPGLGQRHAVQVQPRLGAHLAARHLLVGLVVHPQGGGAHRLGRAGGEVMGALGQRLAANAQGRRKLEPRHGPGLQGRGFGGA